MKKLVASDMVSVVVAVVRMAARLLDGDVAFVLRGIW